MAFAAGEDKLIVLLPDQKTIQRWDMARWEQDLTKVLDFPVPPTIVAMGSASQGPVLVAGGDAPPGCVQLLDLGTLQSAGPGPPQPAEHNGADMRRRRLLAGACFGRWPGVYGLGALRPPNRVLRPGAKRRPAAVLPPARHGRLPAPSPDGQRIYTPKASTRSRRS